MLFNLPDDLSHEDDEDDEDASLRCVACCACMIAYCDACMIAKVLYLATWLKAMFFIRCCDGRDVALLVV